MFISITFFLTIGFLGPPGGGAFPSLAREGGKTARETGGGLLGLSNGRQWSHEPGSEGRVARQDGGVVKAVTSQTRASLGQLPQIPQTAQLSCRHV